MLGPPWVTQGKHVFATLVQPDVMAPAQPADVQRLVVGVVMGIDRGVAADLAALLLQRPGDKRPPHGKVGPVLG